MLNEIENQTDYLFIYSNKVNTNEKVSIKAKQKAVANVLNTLLEKKKMSYSMEGNHIILSMLDEAEAKANEAKVTSVQQQKKRITGTVVDETGTPVIGANVIEVGTTNGTITDVNGGFSLQIDDNAMLRVTYIGYLEQEVNTANRTSVDIILLEDTRVLDEIVVVGYGTQRKRDVAGAISSISSKDLSIQSAINVQTFCKEITA